jgi:predicted transcriptional regulator
MRNDSEKSARRPKKIGVTVRLDELTHEKVVRLAERNERSVAFLIERALRELLAKYDAGQLDLDLG